MWGAAGLGTGLAANYVYRNPFWNDSYAGTVNYAQPIATTAYDDADANDPAFAINANQTANPANNAAGPANQPGALQLTNDDESDKPSDTDVADSDDEEELEPNETEKQAIAKLDEGREAFRAGKYAEAQKLSEEAIKLFPEDHVAHEFRALSLFAQQKYRESAAATYAILHGGPGWDETTLLSFYPDRKVYDLQLAALKHYAEKDPKAADAQFLLAYHELTAGKHDAAKAELEKVAKLEPNDQLTSELLKALNAPPSAAPEKPAESKNS
jgi:tetratricopeptide (TPR) repeat protein